MKGNGAAFHLGKDMTNQLPLQREVDAAAKQPSAKQRPQPRLRVALQCNTKSALVSVGPEQGADRDVWATRLQAVFATSGVAFAVAQLNRIIEACRSRDGSIDEGDVNGLLAMVEAAGARNEIEAALAVQMALVHSAALKLLNRASTAEHLPQFDSAGSAAVKLLRTFALQAEALAKLQRGGEQLVRVVHVHSGGQAVVGNVLTSADSAGAGSGQRGRGGL